MCNQCSLGMIIMCTCKSMFNEEKKNTLALNFKKIERGMGNGKCLSAFCPSLFFFYRLTLFTAHTELSKSSWCWFLRLQENVKPQSLCPEITAQGSLSALGTSKLYNVRGELGKVISLYISSPPNSCVC